MKRLKGFGARREAKAGRGGGGGVGDGAAAYVKNAAAKIISSPQCLPGLYSPAREASRRRSVDDARFKEERSEEKELAMAQYVARRRSVDDSRFRESEDLQAVRREIWKASPSDSFSSLASSSRPSDASVMSWEMLQQGAVVMPPGEAQRATVLGFDANAREGGVSAAVLWAFRNVLRRGDVLLLVGVLDYIRGPLGYKVQVNDRTWLGGNRKALLEEIRALNAAWLAMPGLKKMCEDAGVRLVVDVKAAARAEVAIVQEAVSIGAVHVVLDKSLYNRRRRYYLERLSCDVTRMRRSGGVDSIRSLASIASDREKARISMASPTSVLMPISQRPPRGHAPLPTSSAPDELLISSDDFNSSLSHLVKLVEEKNGNSNPSTIDEAEELFSIDHAFMARRVNMLLAPPPDLMDYRRDQLAMDDVDQGYESDDLFSLAGDGASRRPSVAVFCPPESARSSIVLPAPPRSSYDFSRLALDSGPRLDKRLLPS